MALPSRADVVNELTEAGQQGVVLEAAYRLSAAKTARFSLNGWDGMCQGRLCLGRSPAGNGSNEARLFNRTINVPADASLQGLGRTATSFSRA